MSFAYLLRPANRGNGESSECESVDEEVERVGLTHSPIQLRRAVRNHIIDHALSSADEAVSLVDDAAVSSTDESHEIRISFESDQGQSAASGCRREHV